MTVELNMLVYSGALFDAPRHLAARTVGAPAQKFSFLDLFRIGSDVCPYLN